MNRGQAAMEFVTTYGWAILVLVAMIGALAYFGVVNPRNSVPEQCLFSAGFTCRDFQLQHNAGALRMQVTLENKQPDAIILRRANATLMRGTQVYSNCGIVAPTAVIDVDGTYQLTCTFPAATSPGVGQRAKVGLWLNYTTIRGTYGKTGTGTIEGFVQ